VTDPDADLSPLDPLGDVGRAGPHEDRAEDRGEDRGEVDLVVVLLRFSASDAARLLGVLAKYVVLSRNQPGCRNIDLVMSATRPGHIVVIEKWETAASQQAHFDSLEMVEMAAACRGLLSGPPDIDLFDPVSAHDLL
jgi:quinol monooxygenase YgiN